MDNCCWISFWRRICGLFNMFQLWLLDLFWGFFWEWWCLVYLFYMNLNTLPAHCVHTFTFFFSDNIFFPLSSLWICEGTVLWVQCYNKYWNISIVKFRSKISGCLIMEMLHLKDVLSNSIIPNLNSFTTHILMFYNFYIKWI